MTYDEEGTRPPWAVDVVVASGPEATRLKDRAVGLEGGADDHSLSGTWVSMVYALSERVNDIRGAAETCRRTGEDDLETETGGGELLERGRVNSTESWGVGGEDAFDLEDEPL